MDFFKSVFSSQPDPPPGADDAEDPEVDAAEGELHGSAAASDSDPGSSGGAVEEVAGGGGGASWGAFSGMIRTLATRSESVVQTYRRDLEEFGSGLRKETAAIREVIWELPSSLEAGASVAQESLESVGQAIDDLGGSVWRGTAEIIAQGKDALLAMDSDGSADGGSSPSGASAQSGGASGRPYSRFEARVMGIQSDPASFSEEPDDTEDFRTWISGFQLTEMEAEIESLLAENRALEGNLARLIPQVVDYDTFWSRYFYKVHKLRQAEDVRANLVKRVISREEEEDDLSWEVDDEDTPGKDSKGEEKHEQQQKVAEEHGDERGGGEADAAVPKKEEFDETTPDTALEEKSVKNTRPENVAEIALASASKPSGENVPSETKEECSESSTREAAIMVVDKMPSEGKGEPVESCKDSDVSVVSSQASMPEEDDLGWDEIEDLGDNDEKKVGVSAGSPNKIDLRKKLSAAEEDEDLSWDIEDDEPIKP